MESPDADGEWHGEHELRKITPYPDEWLKELRYAGHEVAREGAAPIVRLRIPGLPRAM
jgi:hypothetical protein